MSAQEDWAAWLQSSGVMPASEETEPDATAETSPKPRMPKPDPTQGGSGEATPIPAALWFADLLSRL